MSQIPEQHGASPTGKPPARQRFVTAGVLAAVLTVAGVVAVILVIALGSSSGAHEHGPVESIFQDDQLLVYSPPAAVASTLSTLQSLGVDRLRITVLWQAIAPPAKPKGFHASDPASYPATAWAPFDRVVALARSHGIAVDFNVTAPGPVWAMKRGAPGAKYATHFEPSAAAFGHFVTAVGKRYSGSYTPPGARSPLPRVTYWTIWNEPNQPGWLAPQWQKVAGKPVAAAPRLYRSYVKAAFAALGATGHTTSSDTILIGELAPEGTEATKGESPIPPLPFLRSLYCVDGSYRPLQGAAAAAVKCPGTDPGAFVKANPGLFDPTGFAHHPYSFFLAPGVGFSDPNFVPISQLSRLEHALDAIFAAYGVHRELPIYITEYGYETRPPDPFRGVPLDKQAQYLDQAQYMAWKDPRVRSMAQFLLVDSAPNPTFPRGSIGYWSTFQTGLELQGGKRKPSYAAYRLPIYVARPAFPKGASVPVWGMLRPALNGTLQQARIQWRGSGGRPQTLATASTSDPSGFLTANVDPPGSGSIRIVWSAPGGKVVRSRAVTVTQKG